MKVKPWNEMTKEEQEKELRDYEDAQYNNETESDMARDENDMDQEYIL